MRIGQVSRAGSLRSNRIAVGFVHQPHRFHQQARRIPGGRGSRRGVRRIEINLNPLDERKIHVSDIIRRLQPELAKVDGISLFMQPVQDLTVEDRVSRTEFQYSLEDVDAKELSYWVPRFMEKLSAIPVVRDVASDQLNQGLLASLVIDRDTASRLGVLPSAIDICLRVRRDESSR